MIGFIIGHGCDGSPTRSVTIRIPAGVTAAKPRAEARLEDHDQAWQAAPAGQGLQRQHGHQRRARGHLERRQDRRRLVRHLRPSPRHAEHAGEDALFPDGAALRQGRAPLDRDPKEGTGRSPRSRRLVSTLVKSTGRSLAKAVTQRELIRSVAAATLAILALSPAAAAHGGGGALGYRSKIVRISPAITGLSLTVVDYDDRLRAPKRDQTRPSSSLATKASPTSPSATATSIATAARPRPTSTTTATAVSNSRHRPTRRHRRNGKRSPRASNMTGTTTASTG